MADKNRGMAWLLAAAAAAGVMMEMQHHRHAGPAAATTSSAPVVPASSAVGTAVPPPHAATRAQIETTLATLEHGVKAGASDAKAPWILAQGLLAFGPHFAADDERPAVDAIASYAERKQVGGRTLYAFPEKKHDSLVEPQPGMLVESMLDAGVPLDRKLVASDATEVTLGRLVRDLQSTARMPGSDADWHQAPWTLGALALDSRLGDKDAHSGNVDLARLCGRALSRLEQDDRVLTEFHGDPTSAFAAGSSLRKARLDGSGIYGYASGGLPLVQAVVECVMQGGSAADKRRMRRQLGVLLFRYEAERHTYAALLSRHPEAALGLRVHQQRFFGYLLETLALARQLGAYDPHSGGGQRIDRVMLDAAGDLATVVKQLDKSGVYGRLDAIRKDHERTYLDLIGDGCHAIRGLRQTLDVLPK